MKNKPYKFLVSFAYTFNALSKTFTGFGNNITQSSSKFFNPFDNNDYIESLKEQTRFRCKKKIGKEYYLLDLVILTISRIE